MAAFFWALTLWQGATWWIEAGPQAHRSMHALMNGYRRRWMKVYGARNLRVVDVGILTNLQNSSAFFASTALLGVGGVVAMISQPDTLSQVAEELPLVDPGSAAAWEIKLFFLLWLTAYAFLKFAWSHRLFGYAAVVLGATPHYENKDSTPMPDDLRREIEAIAGKAADITIFAGRSFNRGLRGVYFALGALGWLLGPAGLAFSATLVALMIYRREFRSESRAALERPI